MSNKPFTRLNELDQKLRRIKPVDMSDTTKLTIRMINGFELFNTRPYHNYETWADGYIVEDEEIKVQSEDLDDAINEFIAVKENPITAPWSFKDKERRVTLMDERRENWKKYGKHVV